MTFYMQKYAINMQIYVKICRTMHKKYAKICENKDSICKNMHKYARNMQKYASKICRNMQEICRNMQKYASVLILHILHLYAFPTLLTRMQAQTRTGGRPSKLSRDKCINQARESI